MEHFRFIIGIDFYYYENQYLMPEQKCKKNLHEKVWTKNGQCSFDNVLWVKFL